MDNRKKLNQGRKITQTKEYDRVFKNGKKYSGSFLKIHVLKTLEKEGKSGIIISRKVKGSVIRNRYKRLLREVFRLNQYAFGNNAEVVVVVFKKIEKASYAIMEDEINRLMEKAGYLIK